MLPHYDWLQVGKDCKGLAQKSLTVCVETFQTPGQTSVVISENRPF